MSRQRSAVACFRGARRRRWPELVNATASIQPCEHPALGSSQEGCVGLGAAIGGSKNPQFFIQRSRICFQGFLPMTNLGLPRNENQNRYKYVRRHENEKDEQKTRTAVIIPPFSFSSCCPLTKYNTNNIESYHTNNPLSLFNDEPIR